MRLPSGDQLTLPSSKLPFVICLGFGYRPGRHGAVDAATVQMCVLAFGLR